MDDQQSTSPPLLRPLPRRPFQQQHSASSHTSSNADTTSQSSHPQWLGSDLPDSQGEKDDISRSRSIINLTSSTLFGIYAPSSFNDASAPPTPWGTGAETPVRHDSLDDFANPRGEPRSSEIEARLLREKQGNNGEERTTSPGGIQQHHAPKSAASIVLRGILRVVLLFCFGLAYGGLIAHLHDNRNVAPVRVEGLNRASWRYLAFWGIAGVGMGSLLPWVDARRQLGSSSQRTDRDARPATGLNSVQWNDVVRSVGAFVGVAFAIRKLPWSSPLQLTLTLALVNPFLWYLVDRTPTGLTLSTLISTLGTATILTVNPALVPSPTDHFTPSSASGNYTAATRNGGTGSGNGILSSESVGVATWIASVLFCACVCFGSIGRLLVPSSPPPSSPRGKRRVV